MTNNYQADGIKTLDFFEHIRKYPGMYIGSKDQKGLHHCVKECISNSIDEWLNNFGDTIIIEINEDNGSITVEDNARGIPHGEHSPGISTLRACFGIQNTGGKFINASGEGGYNTSGGEHGIGTKAVNALSTKLIATSFRDGKAETVEFSKGIFIKSSTEKSNKQGLKVIFYPDKDIFETTKVDINIIENMLREFSYLCPKLKFIYRTINNKNVTEKIFISEKGLVDYINYLSKDKTQLFAPIHLSAKEGNFQVDAIVGYTNAYNTIYKLYTNNIPQDKGTHLTGFKTAWTTTLNQWARDKKLLKEKDENLTGGDYEEGQILILNFKMIDPVFKGQNKEELSSSEGRTFVQKFIAQEARYYFDTHEKDIKIIIERALSARKAREAAKKAREQVREGKKRREKKVINPDKLKDAETLGQNSTLLLVEGLSAGASMAVARDISKYGILMLRGKLINAFTNSAEKLAKNEEIQLLLNALGIIPGAYDPAHLRYGRVAICVDPDSDGQHIGLLIMAALQHFCPRFLEEGRLCWLRAPLYIAKQGKKEIYYFTDDDMNKARAEGSLKGEVQRNKGLGSLSAEQARVSMFGENQRMDILKTSDEAIQLLYDLMSESVVKRKEFIFNNLDFSEVRE